MKYARRAADIAVHSTVSRRCDVCGQDVPTHLVEYVKRIPGGRGFVEGVSRKLFPHACGKVEGV